MIFFFYYFFTKDILKRSPQCYPHIHFLYLLLLQSSSCFWTVKGRWAHRHLKNIQTPRRSPGPGGLNPRPLLATIIDVGKTNLKEPLKTHAGFRLGFCLQVHNEDHSVVSRLHLCTAETRRTTLHQCAATNSPRVHLSAHSLTLTPNTHM